jgi:hypothetical protein
MAQKRKTVVTRRETKEIDTSWLQQDVQPSSETNTQPAWPAALPPSASKPRRRSSIVTERPPARRTVKPPR